MGNQLGSIRVQFFLDGPFDPVETLSITFLNELHDVEEIVVLPGQHELTALGDIVAQQAASYFASKSYEQELPFV